MIKMRFYEKYKGTYVKEFETELECDKWIHEHFEIYKAEEWVDGKWVSV